MNCSEINELLDKLMDDEISDDMRRELELHAAACPQCAENIRATIEMKEMLDGLKEEADVPLAAQSAWRKAVKQEAAKIKAKKIYRSIGYAVAALVMIVGIGFAVDNDLPGKTNENNIMLVSETEESAITANIASIESDGSDVIMTRSVFPEADMQLDAEIVYQVENTKSACNYIIDLVAEYDGSLEEENTHGNKIDLRVKMPVENVNEFLNASRHLNVSGNFVDAVQIDKDGIADILITINE